MTKDESVAVHEGGCLCGAVRYRVRGLSTWVAGCCCHSCTRAAGAPFIVWAGFDPINFEIVAGALSIYKSSPGVERGFCQRCGTTLTYGRDLATPGEDIYISTITLDEPEAYPPEEHVYYAERAKWFHLGGSAPIHDTLSPDNADKQLAGLESPDSG